MIQIDFTSTDIDQLKYERFHHPHPRVQQKMEALLLKNYKLPHHRICEIVGISESTLTRYFNSFRKGGIAKLKEIHFHQPKSALAPFHFSIELYLEEHPPKNANEAAALIKEISGIQRSPSQIRTYMKSIGMKCCKVGMIPTKADSAKQKVFREQHLEPLLEEAKKEERLIYFVDAAHFVLAPFLGFLWSFTRIFIKAPAGRKRLNVLGALNAMTHELVTVCNDKYINSESVCLLLRRLAKLHSNLSIILIMDNARYQKCRLVMELASTLNIELLFLTPYSPNLNLIERLRKFVKKECLYSEYYETFDDCKGAISDCLAKTHTTHKIALDSLLTLNFQTF